MLDAIRRGALNWLAKIMLGLLIVAFAVWGVADVFRGYGRGTLAQIGKTEISVDEYRQAYHDELASLQRRMGGRRLTPEQARLLGVEQRTLSRLIGVAAIETHARNLGLAVSDKTIADLIREDPAFHDLNGKFSTETFRSVLRQNGYTEARYVDTRRKDEVREQITDTLLAGVAPPQLLIDLLHGYRGETRTIEFFTPDYAKLVKVPEPDEAKLEEYYEQNKRAFMTPELRKANVLLITRTDVKSRMAIGEDEVTAAYEQDKDRFNIPEKRRIQQLAFPDKTAAEKAYAELAKAGNLAEAAAKLGFKEADIDLGLLARKDMIDPKIAEAAFALPKDTLSKPVDGQFSVVLLRVSEIVPGKQRTFEEVQGEIRDRLAEERASHELGALHDSVENERSAGKPLKEIGEKLGLTYREIAGTDRSGKTADGKPALEHAEASRVAQAVFEGSVGLEAEATDLGDGGYAWVDVVAVTPEQQKPFEAVRDEVKTATIEAERRKEIAALASKLVERLAQGESMEALAKEMGGKLEKTPAVTRTTTPPGLPQNGVQQAFALPQGGATSALTTDGKARLVLRVASVMPAALPTPEQTANLKGELTRQLQGDVLAEYVAGLQTRYGLSVNDAAMRQALGTGGRDQSDLQ